MYYEDYELFGIEKDSDSDISHYGIKRRSGRYPWGSGDDPYQHENGYPFKSSTDFYTTVRQWEKEGKNENQISEELGITLREFRTYKKLARADKVAADMNNVQTMHDQGFTNTDIGKKLGLTEGTIRNYLKANAEPKELAARQTADFLKSQIDERGMIDIGAGVELELNKSRANIEDAILILQAEGYPVYPRRQPQVTNPGQTTTMMVACPPGTEYKDIYKLENINSIVDFTADENEESGFRKYQYPESLDSKRLMINYGDKGGKSKDGLIEVRRGVDDLYLGDGVHYSQVRILVDGTHYLKGMCCYADDLPDGVDVRFNTNKPSGTPALGDKKNSVLKPIKKDNVNPFGSTIPAKGQSTYIDENGETKLRLINKTRNEGEWDEWKNELPSQFLAKQNMPLIKQQLSISMKDKEAEFKEIMSVNNPTVKKELLDNFASDCDSAAVHLKAASLPRQKYQVILPVDSLSDNEIYAPNYKNGEKVALVRFPYAGYFESPLLTVNNKNKEAQSRITPNALDAVGINGKVAAQLSGADFDGDTVLVIPAGKSKAMDIRTGKPLKGLDGFETSMYPEVAGMKYLSKEQQQNEMGKVSNLIMDMTLRGAPPEQITRAVKHSMVIIDAEKHNLNYKLSEQENGIAELVREYKGRIENDKYTESASTLITRAASEVDVPKRRGQPWINIKGKDYYDPTKPEGSLIYKNARDKDLYYTDEKGKTKMRTQKSTQMAETDDPFKLSSGLPVENEYGKYASFCKNLANKARKEMVSTGKIEYSKSAANRYSEEVSSLLKKLNDADKNRARERYSQLQAQIEINRRMDIYKYENPNAKKTELGKERKKYAQQAIEVSRAQHGAKGAHIDITDREWEAIQSGALHETTLRRILQKTDIDKIRDRATPKQQLGLTSSQVTRINTLKKYGYSNEDIAHAVGVSASTVVRYLKDENKKKGENK